MNDDQLDQLLARGHLSGAQYDRIEALLFTQLSPKARPRRSRFLVAAALSLAGLGGLAVLRYASPDVAFSEYTAKGAGGLNGSLDVACGSSGGHVCTRGSSLLFVVNSAVVAGYAGAYATKVDRPESKIWYFPSTEGHSPHVSEGSATLVLPEGVLIGEEHTPGRYKVTFWISKTPVVRGKHANGAIVAHEVFDIEVR